MSPTLLGTTCNLPEIMLKINDYTIIIKFFTFHHNDNYCFVMITMSFSILDPGSVRLKQEVGRRCFFPDGSGHLNIDPERVGASGQLYGLIVEGAPEVSDGQCQ